MAERRRKRAFRLRRTVTAGGPYTGKPLRRAIWGVSGAAARYLFEERRSSLSRQAAELESQAAVERAETERLKDEIARHKERLQALRQVIQVFRMKLAKERAARAVLAARLLDRHAEELKEIQASEIRLETAVVGAEAQREHDALQGLVAALYRTVAGRGGIPADLEVAAALQAPPRSPSQLVTSEEAPAAPREEWHRFLTGKVLARTIHTSDGFLLAREGDVITAETIAAAEQDGKLFELILNLKLPE